MLILITAISCYILGFLSCLIPVFFVFKIIMNELEQEQKQEEQKEAVIENEIATEEKRQMIENQNILKEWLYGGEE